MAIEQEKKITKAKIFALIISSLLHAVAIYYLGLMALDYIVPEGTVDSMEMTYDANGTQTDTTEISVTDSLEQAPAQTPNIQPNTVPTEAPTLAPTSPKPIASPSNLLPAKQTTSESEVESTQEQSPVVVAPPSQEITKEDIPEDLLKDTYAQDKTKDIPNNDPLPETTTPPEENLPPVPTPVPTENAAPANATAPEQTAKPYGRPEGVQSDKVLKPLPGNKNLKVPMMARMRKLEGITLIHYNVSAEGLVTEVNVIQSSGHSVLDNEAIDTVKTWKFQPTGEAGIYERPIRFQLKGEAQEAPGKLRRTN